MKKILISVIAVAAIISVAPFMHYAHGDTPTTEVNPTVKAEIQHQAPDMAGHETGPSAST